MVEFGIGVQGLSGVGSDVSGLRFQVQRVGSGVQGVAVLGLGLKVWV